MTMQERLSGPCPPPSLNRAGFAGSYTIVKDSLRARHARAQEMFVLLAHPPGHAQVDFGEAVAVIGGVQPVNATVEGQQEG